MIGQQLRIRLIAIRAENHVTFQTLLVFVTYCWLQNEPAQAEQILYRPLVHP
ncbi:MAG: hypothetical protein AB1733_09125 [Thermodesulfobacteriota bacterium]